MSNEWSKQKLFNKNEKLFEEARRIINIAGYTVVYDVSLDKFMLKDIDNERIQKHIKYDNMSDILFNIKDKVDKVYLHKLGGLNYNKALPILKEDYVWLTNKLGSLRRKTVSYDEYYSYIIDTSKLITDVVFITKCFDDERLKDKKAYLKNDGDIEIIGLAKNQEANQDEEGTEL